MTKIDVIPPPMSWRVKAACYFCGTVSLVMGGITVVAFFTAQGRGTSFSFWPMVPAGTGVVILQMPWTLEKARRELLARREGGETTLTLAEQPHISDSAMVGFLFGMTGLVATTLLSPLAVVFGVVALFNRSLMGLLGIGLGLAGIGLWLWMAGVLKDWLG